MVGQAGNVLNGNAEIYIMENDGGNPKRLTQNERDNSVGEFSPDGSKTAFTSKHEDNYEVYIMKVDGSHPLRLTYNPGMDGGPHFQT